MAEKQFWRNASDQLTFGMSDVPADDYKAVCVAVAKEFHLTEHTLRVLNGYDIVFQDYRLDDKIVGLEWDNWTGFTVVAQVPTAEPHVQDIGAWLIKTVGSKSSK